MRCRPVEISQVVLNLIGNAYDAIGAHCGAWIRLEISREGNWTCLSVTDSGPGIPEELRQSIMQPFFTTKRGVQGMGLGLSLAKRIIEGHGGTLIVDSECPHTRFVAQLPNR